MNKKTAMLPLRPSVRVGGLALVTVLGLQVADVRGGDGRPVGEAEIAPQMEDDRGRIGRLPARRELPASFSGAAGPREGDVEQVGEPCGVRVGPEADATGDDHWGLAFHAPTSRIEVKYARWTRSIRAARRQRGSNRKLSECAEIALLRPQIHREEIEARLEQFGV